MTDPSAALAAMKAADDEMLTRMRADWVRAGEGRETMDELLPCPFCGGPAQLYGSQDDEQGYGWSAYGSRITCPEKTCAGWTIICSDPDEWNRRDPMAAVRLLLAWRNPDGMEVIGPVARKELEALMEGKG